MPDMPGLRRTIFGSLPREVAILTSISFTVALGYGIVAPVIPEFARHFGVSTAAASAVISAFALMRIAGALPAGRLVDRLGERPVMVAGLVIVAASSLLAGLSGSFYQLIALRGVGGLGSAMFSISGQTLLLRSVPSELRGRASGRYTGGFLLGGISGPAIGGAVAAWSQRAPFFIYGVLLVVPAIIAATALGGRSDHRATAGPRPSRSGGAAGAGIAAALRSTAYRAAAMANLADGFAVMGVRAAIVPLFVADVLHRSATWTGVGFLLVAAVNGATLLPAGRAADTAGRRPVLVAGCVTSAGAMVMLAVLPGLWGFLVALTVLGLGSGLLDVAPSAMVGDVIGRIGSPTVTAAAGETPAAGPKDTAGGAMVAGYQMLGDLGTVTGPVAVGFLVDSVSYGAAFLLAAGVLAVAAILGLFAPETGPASNRRARHRWYHILYHWEVRHGDHRKPRPQEPLPADRAGQ
jgi:MFS family permease